MRFQRRLVTAICFILLLTGHLNAFAAGGTSLVATKGQSVPVAESWPEGVGDIVNDKARTTGWNSWFTEWPNDVNQYAFEINSGEDLNRLIEKLAAVKGNHRSIHLSHLKEPASLGWVTRVPEGNGIPVIFSIGDQARIDQWFQRVRKPFGVMEFTDTPVAVPPTLTIFVSNDVVDLSKLRIPDGIDVSLGYVPTVFHRANTTLEAKREKETAAKDAEKANAEWKQGLDEEARATVNQIEAFVVSHKDGSDTTSKPK